MLRIHIYTHVYINLGVCYKTFDQRNNVKTFVELQIYMCYKKENIYKNIYVYIHKYMYIHINTLHVCACEYEFLNSIFYI